MENVNKKILLVEDDLNFGAVLKDYLMLNDFDVTLAKNGMEGFGERYSQRNAESRFEYSGWNPKVAGRTLVSRSGKSGRT